MDPVTLLLAKKYTDKAIEEAGGLFTVTVTANVSVIFLSGFTVDKTYAEIENAMSAGTTVVAAISLVNSIVNIVPVERAYKNGQLVYHIHAPCADLELKDYDIYINASDAVSYEESKKDVQAVVIPLSKGYLTPSYTTYYYTNDYMWRGVDELVNRGAAVAFSVPNGTYLKEIFWLTYYNNTDNLNVAARCIAATPTGCKVLSVDNAYFGGYVQFDPPEEKLFEDPSDIIKLTESNGELVAESQLLPYTLKGYVRFYMDYWDSSIDRSIGKAFTLVSIQAWGLSTVEIIIKDNSNDALYKYSGGYYTVPMRFQPYTP